MKRFLRIIQYIGLRSVIFIVIIFVLSSFISSEPKKKIRKYTLKEGLSQALINSIVQDDKGFIWLATEDGLNRFDGYSFSIFKYDPDIKFSLADNYIQHIFKDSEGTLWVSSRKGLQEFDRLKEKFVLYRCHPKARGPFSENDVSYITDSRSKNLWIAWYGSGFAYFDKRTKTYTPYTQINLPELSSEKTIVLHEDKFGLLWVGTQDGGLTVFEVSNGKVIRTRNEILDKTKLPSLNIKCIREDHFGNVWIGTSKGLALFQRDKNKLYLFDNNLLKGKSVFSLLEDSRRNLWIGLLKGAGILKLDLSQVSTSAPENFAFEKVTEYDNYDLSKNTIQSIYEDRDRNIWIGTYGDGVFMIGNTREKFIKIQAKQNHKLSGAFVQYYGICNDKHGDLWLGTDGDGIYETKPNGEIVTHYYADGKKGSLLDNNILSALNDHDNNLWFGTYSHGLFKYDKKAAGFIHYSYDNQGNKNHHADDIRVIFEDSQHHILIGTNRSGLCMVNHESKTITNYPHPDPKLKNFDIRSITEDKKGGIWLGCYGDGVYYLNPFSGSLTRRFYNSEDDNPLKSNVVFAVFMDTRERIWIGTEGGLVVYDHNMNKLKRYSEKNGLANNTIYAIVQDNAGIIWVSTNKGISKLDIDKEEFSNYDYFDGVQEGLFNPGSVLRNKVDGYICFGGNMGLNIFYPDQIVEDLNDPVALISGFRVFNKPVEVSKQSNEVILDNIIGETKELTLKHYQSVFTFEFIAINYCYPEKNRYAYKMSGLDKEWNYVGNERAATYRYLPAGNYEFMVKASNQNSVWGSKYTSVKIRVLPPFWKTPIAYLLYLSLLSFISFWLFTYWKRQLRLKKKLMLVKVQRKKALHLAREKLGFFTEVSHEFRTPLTLIIGPLEEMINLEARNSTNGSKLRMVYRNANKLLNLINQLLDYRKAETGKLELHAEEDDIVTFAEEIYIVFNEQAIKKNINLVFHASEPSIKAWFDKEKMEMILNNLLSNSFKYIGNGDHIDISIYKEEKTSGNDNLQFVTIQVKDNGIGMSEKQLRYAFDWFYQGNSSTPMSSGIGLALTKKLIELHKGKIFLESTEGKGTSFILSIPLEKGHLAESEMINAEKSNTFVLKNRPDIFVDSEQASNIQEKNKQVGTKKILIVEDDVEIRSFLKSYLSTNFLILEANDGKEGLSIAFLGHPDIVISDIMMPGMNGIDFCKELKTNLRTSHIPVILLTAKTSFAHNKAGLEIGADAYITKPFSPELLSLTIKNMLLSRENLKRFYRNLFTNEDLKKETLVSPDEKFLYEIHELLKANLDKPEYNAKMISDDMHMSRSLFYKKVKILTGLAPVEYIRSLRMQEAAKLLKTNRYKIFEIVYMVGLSDIKYFRECFFKEFGCQPSKYLEKTNMDD